jgi:thiamine biosynthesis lipoprotein
MSRRARLLLGTLVEVGADDAAAITEAFEAIAHVHARMSRFEASSDIGRFHALPRGGSIEVDAQTAEVLAAAADLHAQSDGAFDVALGSAGDGWRIDGATLTRLDAGVRLDLGGIAKGHAVDRGIAALRARGCRAGYVNAGGDLRVFGALELPVVLRDERRGGVRPFCTLSDGALATSHFAASSRSTLFATRRAGGADAAGRHVSVAAPTCLMADALTKVVAAAGRTDHPLLARHGAIAWRH